MLNQDVNLRKRGVEAGHRKKKKEVKRRKQSVKSGLPKPRMNRTNKREKARNKLAKLGDGIAISKSETMNH